MPIQIDEIHTQVEMSPDHAAGAEAAPSPPAWQLQAQARETLAQLLRDEQRTRAQGNED